MRRPRKPLAVTGVVLLVTAAGLAAGTRPAAAAAPSPESPFVAGKAPDRRPDGAPVLKDYPKDAAWYGRALTGITTPYPYSLRFLEDQGAWYTPFIHPGMLPPYDLRGWFGRSKPGRSTTGHHGKKRKKRRK